MSQKISPPKKVELNLPSNFHDLVQGKLMDALVRLEQSSVPKPWGDTVGFKVSYLKSNIWTKYYDDSETGAAESRRSKAIAKWLAVEERNAGTNLRLCGDADFGPFTSDAVRERARIVVRKVLGDVPEELFTLGEFTNGASTRIRRGPGASARKYVGLPHATEEAWSVFKEKVLPLVPLWDRYSPELSGEVVDGSVMFTVPKNTEIDRVACKEPEINMYMQRACGLYFRRRLRDVAGINLQDQTQNQRLAREGSRFGKLATLDLSSASDSISSMLVSELLPADWFVLLDKIRSKRVNIDGCMHEMHMFSSMGNGFTFELETLLFYALAKATCYLTGSRGRVSVYGDDIILPSRIAALFGRVLNWFGFSLNKKKSSWKGGFRESCGKHYYFGADVSPFFIREPITTLPRLILFLNQWRQWCVHPEAGMDLVSDVGYHVWNELSSYVPKFLWGGKDPASMYSLVTCDRPRYALKQGSRERFVNQVGGYLRWMNVAERTQDCVTSSESVDGPLVYGRNRTWCTALPLNLQWLEETFVDLCAIKPPMRVSALPSL